MTDRAANLRAILAEANRIDPEDALTLLIDAAALICAKEDWCLENVILHLIDTTQTFREVPPEDAAMHAATPVGHA